MIPTIFIGSGNIATAKTYIGFGRRLLNKLKTDLSFQKLPTGRTQPFYCGDGTTIRCEVNYGLSKVFIHSPFEEGLEATCLCLPHFSTGTISARYPEEPTDDFLKTGRFYYDVDVCTLLTYIKIESVYDANFGTYKIGQVVMVSIGNEMLEWPTPLDCDRFCLMQQPRFEKLIITPIYVPGQMVTIEDEEESEDGD